MDGCGLPSQPRWMEQGDSSQSLLQRSTSRRGLGKTPLLCNSMRSKEHPFEGDDRSQALWSSPNVRSDIFTPGTKILSYKTLAELSCFDSFNLVDHDVEVNKVEPVEFSKSSPPLIPAKMKESLPALEESDHSVFVTDS